MRVANIGRQDITHKLAGERNYNVGASLGTLFPMSQHTQSYTCTCALDNLRIFLTMCSSSLTRPFARLTRLAGSFQCPNPPLFMVFFFLFLDYFSPIAVR